MKLVERRPLAPFGLFTLTRIQRCTNDTPTKKAPETAELVFA